MGVTRQTVPFRKFIGFLVIEHGVFAIPVLTLLVLFRPIPIDDAFFLIALFFVLVVPISACMAYLHAKGSNWVNTRMAFLASGVLPGQIYFFLLGGMIGFQLWTGWGGVIGGVIGFGLGTLAGAKVAQIMFDRVVPVGGMQP